MRERDGRGVKAPAGRGGSNGTSACAGALGLALSRAAAIGAPALGRLATLLAFGAIAACDRGDEAPARSRVQAVLAEPGSTRVSPSAEPVRSAPAPSKPRPALCAGQLEPEHPSPVDAQ